VAITQEFGRNASKLVGDYAETKIKESNALRAQAEQTTDPAERAALLEKAQALDDNWGENGRLRLAAHMTIGGLTGGLGGALGAGAGTLTAPQINALLADSNLDPDLRQALIALASTAAGAAAGGLAGNPVTGGAGGFNEVTNNYLTHVQINQWVNEMEACQKTKSDCSSIIKKYQALDIKQQEELISVCATNTTACESMYRQLLDDKKLFLQAVDNAMSKDLPLGYSLGVLLYNQREAEGVVGSTYFAQKMQEKYKLSPEVAEGIASGLLAAMTGITSSKGKGSGSGIKTPNSQIGAIGSGGKPNALGGVKIDMNKQNKHIEGTNEYKTSNQNGTQKSIVTVNPDVLVNKIGTGQQVGNLPVGVAGSKERINFGTTIGYYVDAKTGQRLPTTNGIVHYSSTGAHIVPSAP